MSDVIQETARDTYPHIVYFYETFHELEIAVREDLLWPCHSYAIAIPARNKNRLNIFEELVLKLTALGNGDTGAIADFSCLEPDIVFFIQSRLHQNGYLNERFSISDSGRELLGQWDSEKTQYTTATVYRDGISGSLLPFVNIMETAYEEVKERTESFIKFSVGSTGRGRDIRARVIRGDIRPRTPDIREVLRALGEHRRLYTRYAALRGATLQPPYTTGSAISIQPQEERIYLHCRLILPRGNPDILVSDGFGLGYSKNFASFLDKQNWSWLINFKERGIVEDISEGSNEAIPVQPVKRDILKRAREAIAKWKNKQPSSFNEGREKKHDIDNAITTLYDALEHTLSAVVFEFPVTEWEKNYEKGSFDNNKRLVEDFAQKLGFYIDKNNAILLEAIPGKIRAINEGAAELQPLLALAITGARYNSVHPCNTLAAEFPDFFDFVLSLKRWRDPIRHGNTGVEIKTVELENLFAKTEKTICILNPGSIPRKGQEDIAVDQKPKAGYDQQRLQASIRLDKFFTHPALQCMDRDMKELLFKIEMSSYDTQEIVNDITSILQRMFYLMLLEQDILNIAGNDKDIRLYICEKALKAGLLKYGEALPVSLKTVNENRLQYAMQGMSVSLQANCAALIGLGSDELLKNIAKKIPELLEFVDKTAEIRKHGNSVIDLEKNIVGRLKVDAFDIVRNLLEVLEWQRNVK